jgi:hypothetical protein
VVAPLDHIRLAHDAEWIQADTVVGLFSSSVPEPPAIASDPLGDFEIVSDATAPLEAERDRVWYCRILKQVMGPFTFDDVHAMAQSGQLGQSDEIREGETGRWMRAGTVVGLLPKASRSQRKARAEFDADRFLTESETPEQEPAPQHIAPQRRAVTTPLRPARNSERSVEGSSSVRSDSRADATAVGPAEPHVEFTTRPAPAERRVAAPAAANSTPLRPPVVPQPRPQIVAPIPVPRPRKSMGNPFAGLGGSLGSVFGGLSVNWKHAAVLVVLLGVAAVLYAGLPFNFSRGPAIYEETLVLWQRAQSLHQSATSDSEWQAFQAETKPRAEQLKTELAEEASAKDRLLQLMLYCYRDCLPSILNGGPQDAPEKWKEMDEYMREAASLAKK